MMCPKCVKEGRGEQRMEMRKAFGRDHHWHCEIDNSTVMVADRLSSSDRENFTNDENAV